MSISVSPIQCHFERAADRRSTPQTVALQQSYQTFCTYVGAVRVLALGCDLDKGGAARYLLNGRPRVSEHYP